MQFSIASSNVGNDSPMFAFTVAPQLRQGKQTHASLWFMPSLFANPVLLTVDLLAIIILLLNIDVRTHFQDLQCQIFHKHLRPQNRVLPF